jgi:Putative beta barrel porin-7 (BBP7)
MDIIFGYRYFNLTDELIIREDLTSLPGRIGVPAGTRFMIEDRFRTENNFHGGVIGVTGERRFGRNFVGYRTSVALGVNHQVTEISGFTIINAPAPNNGVNGRFPGGLLTQPTNIGRYTNDVFAVMPEIGLKLGRQLTPHFRAYVGYNFLYLSNVQRAGDAISLRVNPTQIAPSQTLTGPAAPVFTPKATDFWLQGMSVGLEGRF